MNEKQFKQTIKTGKIQWRKHVLQRMMERGITTEDVLFVLLNGEKIENYTDDKPFESSLFFIKVKNKPLHVVASYDNKNEIVYIITVYEPSLDYFNKDFKTRRKNG